MTTYPLDPDYWVRETRALKRIAQAMLRDEHLAEDAAQSAWVTSLSHGQGGVGVGWLRAVVRSRTLDLRRRRHAGHEQLEANHDLLLAANGSAQDVAERLEVQRLLVEAVEGLEEPYRSTVCFVYLDGMSVRHVAASQGVPASTIYTRLRRALEQLRARLSPKFDGNDGQRFHPSLVAFALGPRVSRASLLQSSPTLLRASRHAATPCLVATTSVIMNKLFMAIAAALVFVGVWLVNQEHGGRPLEPDKAAVQSTRPESQLIPEKLAATDSTASRHAAVDLEASTTQQSEQSASVPMLQVLIRWDDGSLAEGVEVVAAQDAMVVASPKRFTAKSGADGMAVFQLLPVGRLGVRTDRHHWREKVDVEVTSEITTELELRIPNGGRRDWSCG